jgi:hypothetical protein
MKPEWFVLVKNTDRMKKVIPPVLDEQNRDFLFLKEGDILNWDSFIASLRKPGTPLEARVSMLVALQNRLNAAGWWAPKLPHNVDPNLTTISLILNGLRNIISRKDFYDPLVFQDLSEKSKGFIEKGIDELSEIKLRKFNRLLIESIYPGLVRKSQDFIKEDSIIPLLPDEVE